jgi:cell division protein FtsB
MNDIDLIPRSYRDAVRVRRVLGRAAIAMAALLVTGLVMYAYVFWQLRSEKFQLTNFRSEAKRIDGLRKQVDILNARKTSLEHMALTLSALRGAGEIYRTAEAVNSALNAGVWLTSLRFSREQQVLDAAQPTAKPANGYTVIRTASGAGAGQKEDAWRLSNSIQIKGAAIDHTFLAEFMKKLSGQPGIVEVRFLNSNAESDEVAQNIQFSAAAILQPNNRQLP